MEVNCLGSGESGDKMNSNFILQVFFLILSRTSVGL